MLTNHSIILLAAILLFIAHVIVIVHILLTKHEEPVSAVAWLMAIILSPGLGLVCYLLFGINRIYKSGLRVKQSALRFDANLANSKGDFISPPPTDKEAPLFRKCLDRLFPHTVVTTNNAVELLRDGSMAYPAMYKEIKNAKKYIHLQSYIIMNDKVGRELFDLLSTKAEQGVQVKVIYDAIGSISSIISHFFIRYTRRHKNLEVRAFSKLNIFVPWRIQLRNHRKLLVIDGKIAFVGGINISADNRPELNIPKRRDIHDLHCRIEGPAVPEFHKIFLRDWMLITGKQLKNIDQPKPPACGNNNIRVMYSGPGQYDQGTEKLFMAAVSSAKEKLIIMTPYFYAVLNQLMIDTA